MEARIADYSFLCPDENVSFSMIKQEKDRVTVRVNIDFGTRIKPEPIAIRWTTAGNGVYTCWNPTIIQDKVVRPNWRKLHTESRSAFGMPVQCYIGCDGLNCVSVYVSDSRTPMALRSGVIEESGRLQWELLLFSQMTGAMESYSADIIIDERKSEYSSIIADAAKLWMEKEGGSENVPSAVFDPIYSTWYSYHQNITDEGLVKELTAAKKLGMKTVIIDDGWQTDDNSRGYGYCGEWREAKTKIPDLRDFCDRVHAMGMKVMIWFAVPYMGVFSEMKDKFEGMFLNRAYGASNAYILDPRFPKVRSFLAETYEKAVLDWDLDGLKLDFIDSFRLTEDSLTSHPDMDTESLEDGVCMLLGDIYKRLTAVKPDILIEFRQHYIGAVMQKYGNMLRVGDCPMDCVTNRVASVNLRMISGKNAVHSDMLMWNYDDAPEVAAEQFINIMFAVPQISVRINDLIPEHYKMLKFYMDLWLKNQELLMQGELYAKKPEANYSTVCSKNADKLIGVLYSDRSIDVDDAYSEITVVNGAGENMIYIDFTGEKTAYTYTVFDCMGNVAKSGDVSLDGVCKFSVPKSGVVLLKRQ